MNNISLTTRSPSQQEKQRRGIIGARHHFKLGNPPRLQSLGRAEALGDYKTTLRQWYHPNRN
jgi:hypothetical protein